MCQFMSVFLASGGQDNIFLIQSTGRPPQTSYQMNDQTHENMHALDLHSLNSETLVMFRTWVLEWMKGTCPAGFSGAEAVGMNLNSPEGV